MKTIQTWQRFIAPTYSAPKIRLVSGKGSRVEDENGKKYLDFLSGIAVTALGHSHPKISEAIDLQSKSLNHVSNLFANPITEKLADKILEISGFSGGRVFFCNSGAEANEAAIKYVRAAKPRSRLVSVDGSFHGRTFGALSITGQTDKRQPFEPLLSKVDFIQANDVRSIDRKINRRTGGIWIELIQGEGGVLPLEDNFVFKINQLARKYNAALVVDEVQTGIGRTGNWFAFQKGSCVPDLMPLAKGLGGGLPIGALVISSEYIDAIKPGGHGTTFGGNPIAAAAALAVIETIEKENLLNNVEKQGRKLFSSLSSLTEVNQVRGEGLLLGIVLSGDHAKLVEEKCLTHGLIVNAVRPNIIRLAPPLNVSDEEVSEAIEILQQSIDALVQNG